MYLLRLDDGVERDPQGEHVSFDYITDETLAAMDNYEDLDSYVNIHEYLATTQRPPPEVALQAVEIKDETIIEDEPSSDPPDEDPTAVRRPITDRLMKTLHMNFNQFNKKREASLEQALMAHQKNKKIFWEVYSGSGNLATTIEAEGWEVMCCDLQHGWNFELALHRREFLQLQEQVCPEFVWLAPTVHSLVISSEPECVHS